MAGPARGGASRTGSARIVAQRAGAVLVVGLVGRWRPGLPVNVPPVAATNGVMMAPELTIHHHEPKAAAPDEQKSRWAERLAALRDQARSARASEPPPPSVPSEAQPVVGE